MRHTQNMELLFLFLIGLCIGSFCNVLADRLPRGEDVLVSRSHCDFCKKTLFWYELIPVFSFLVQKARCRKCHKKLSFHYPLIELSMGIGFVVIGFMAGPSVVTLVPSLILFSMSVVILVADLKYFIIPDVTLVVMGLVGLFFLTTLPSHEAMIHVVSALATYIGFYMLYKITKEKGMGFGDVKLAGVLGLLLGFPNTVISLYTAFLTGALAGVILMIIGKAKLKTKIPFGPFLLLGAYVSLCWGSRIWQWWIQLL